MVTQIPSRSQRRMERRQAMLLLTLVLAVSLVSFALGVMVGRGRGQQATAAIPAVERRPVTLPGPAVPPAGGGAAQDLTFYDALPKGGKPPLGSGINLPPENVPTPPATPAPQVAQPTPPPQLPPAGQPRVVQPQPSDTRAALPSTASAPPRTVSPSPPIKSAPAKASGSWVIQAGSFRDAADAGKMKQRLAGKGFPVYIQEANLGAKGTWHRVMVGPFDSERAASGAAGRLQSEEKLSVMVRKS